MSKSLLFAAAFAAFMAGGALPSYADDISAEFQFATHYPGSGYHTPYPYPYPDGDYDDDEDDDERITCGEGRRVVRRAGYRNVQPLRCSGDNYRYRAFRRGLSWLVRVDSWSGRIISARRMRTY